MINERIIGTGAGANTVVPSEYFNTVLYTGNGGTQRVGGYINRGAVFNESSSYVAVNDSADLRLTGDYTISFWFKTNAIGSLQRLINKDDATDFSAGYFIMLNTNGTLTIGHNDGANNQNWSPSNTFSANTWYHISVTYSDTANLRTLYINGSSAATQATNTNIASGTDKLFFGTFGSTSAQGQYFNGKLDQVRIFDKALSSSEVTTLYGETHASTTISTTDIFSDGSGVALYQLDGNANDTGLANGARKAIDTTDKAASFNGSSSVIDFSQPLLINTFSVSFWINTTSTASQRILGNPYGGAGDYGLNIRIEATTGHLEVEWSADGTNAIILDTATSVNDGNWHHIVATWDEGGQKIYIDNNEEASSTNASDQYATTDTFKIGANWNNTEHYNGKLDDVRIYSDVLTSTEVGYIYNHTTASIPTDNLVAYYNLDGNSNDTAGSNNGSDTNITYVQSTKKGVERIDSGAAAIFNGSSSYIDVPSGVRQNNNFSFSFWFNTNSTTLGQNAVAFRNGKKFQIGLNNSNVGNGSIRVNAGNNTNVDSATGIFSANTWYHLAVTQSSTGGVKVYLDGSVVASNSGATGDLVSVTGKDVIGAYYSSSYTGFFNGTIDDVRIYTDVLTSTEVGYLYSNTAASIPTDNLQAYYKLDGNALDSANSFDGTESNITYGFDGTASVSYQEATNFTPDLVWIKARNSSGGSNVLFDSVRGLTAPHFLASNLNYAEFGNANTGVTSFDSNGFTVGDDSNGGANVNGASGGTYSGNGTYVSWCFNAGTGAAASNTDGTITSTVKANQDAGFSIVKYTGNGNSSATVGHGLSSTPELLIAKSTSEANNWWTGVKDVNGVLQLDSASSVISSGGTNGAIGIQSTYTSNVFGFLAGTSSVDNANKNGQNYIAYCLHSVDGIQKVGSYTGTGGSVNVETGFEPAWIMIKRTDSAEDWKIIDNKRDNFADALEPNEAIAEENNNNSNFIPTSNGFQMNDTSGDYNANGGTYIYLAIAADPDTTTPVVENSFDVVTYTGSGGTQSIDTAFKPDLIWVKNRDVAVNHYLYDSIRGTGAAKALHSNTTSSESSASTYSVNGGIQSIDSNGFTAFEGTDGTYQGTNKSGNDYIAWVFKAGDHDDNLPQINTEGTTDSIVSVNDASGFSIVKYTAGGTATVGHGLSQPPELIITKNLDITEQWFVYAEPAGTQKFLGLNTDSAATSNSGVYTNVGATTFTNNISGTSRTYINYCFTSITGYQSLGSYTGNGSTNGPTITTGFKPRFIMVKSTSHSGAWIIMDAARDAGRDDEWYARLIPNQSAGEVDDYPTTRRYQILDTGFKVTNVSNSWNGSGRTYIYLAIK